MATPSLTDTLDHAWACMNAGAGPGKSRFSMVQVATVGADGAPRARTVVIRSADAAMRQIAFHTDRRSPKVRELRNDPRVTVIGYDMEAGRQVRIEGVARLHIGDSEALDAWSASRAETRVNYQSETAPGEEIARPGDAGAAPSADCKAGFSHFCRVVVEVGKIDWLDLATDGHRRACHVWTGESWDSAWVAP